MSNIKAFQTRVKDKARVAYAVKAEMIMRRFLVVGTVNTNELSGALPYDASGVRRWVFVNVERKHSGNKIVDYFNEHRDRLFAEALHIVKTGADKGIYVDPPDSVLAAFARAAQANTVYDQIHDPIAEWLTDNVAPGKYSLVELADLYLDYEHKSKQGTGAFADPQDRPSRRPTTTLTGGGTSRFLGTALHKAGWENRNSGANGSKRWHHPQTGKQPVSFDPASLSDY